MLYQVDKKVYIFANNKYYKLELKNNDIVPTKENIEELPEKATLITYEEAIKVLANKGVL